jgi:hypothetical protein
MPKTLVLYALQGAGPTDGATPGPNPFVDAFVEGARSVRFSEVDVRTLPGVSAPSGSVPPPLESVERLADYDAIVIGAPTPASGLAPDVAALLAAAASLPTSGALLDRVGSAFTIPPAGASVWSLLTPLADLGLILVAPPTDGSLAATDALRAQGARVATVAEWVRHAKSHRHS